MKLKHIALIGSLFPILFSLVLFFGVLISADSDEMCIRDRYVRDTILTLEDQRQALLLLTAYFSFEGQSENGCPFLF